MKNPLIRETFTIIHDLVFVFSFMAVCKRFFLRVPVLPQLLLHSGTAKLNNSEILRNIHSKLTHLT